MLYIPCNVHVYTSQTSEERDVWAIMSFHRSLAASFVLRFVVVRSISAPKIILDNHAKAAWMNSNGTNLQVT